MRSWKGHRVTAESIRRSEPISRFFNDLALLATNARAPHASLLLLGCGLSSGASDIVAQLEQLTRRVVSADDAVLGRGVYRLIFDTALEP